MRLLLTVLIAILPLLAHGGSLADLEIFDRTVGQPLTLHQYQGRLYVAGEPGHRYELHIRSRSSQRLLAVTSVDGVNVVSGETAATDQRGYVLDGWTAVTIEGWRKSLEDVATFYFTSLADSYAARTGRPDDIGVIGVAVFAEQTSRHCCQYLEEQRAESATDASGPNAAARANAGPMVHEADKPRLGTGHGEREASPAQYVDFRRASATADETIVIYYDSRRNLVSQGVLPGHTRLVKQQPNPFPAGFVPDPE